VILVLGGGIAGASVAWALARRGHPRVVVHDPGQPLAGSTGRAAGGFRVQQGSRTNIELSFASRPFFSDRAEQILFQPNGYLYLAETEPVALELRRRAEFQREYGVPVEHPEPGSMLDFLKVDDIWEANFCRLDGLYLPALVYRAFVQEASEAGAEFRYGSAASTTDIAAAEAVVVAAGIWSRAVGQSLGVDLNVTPLERGVFQVGPFDWLGNRVPMTLDAGSGYHFREREGRLLVLFPGDQHAWEPVREWLSLRVPQAAVEKPEQHWTGYYEMSFDNHPLVGRTEREGVWASCGFSGHGVMHSPAVAESLAAMILGETPPLDISALDPLRKQGLVDMTQL
jgi:sarcosine oxidase subunit beta